MLPALLFALIHPSAWNRYSAKFRCRILHSPAPIPLESPSPGTPHSPAPLELVTPMDRYARSWIPSDHKQMFVGAIIPEARSDPCPHS
jgi:hypothetical protein